MKIIENEKIDFYDVDDTLVMHQDESTIPEADKVFVVDPVKPGGHIVLRINRNMVRLLKESHARGYEVIVWSRGGYTWAANVIKALKLEGCVSLVCSKPMAYFDDSPVEKWLPYRVYIGPDQTYKQRHND